MARPVERRGRGWGWILGALLGLAGCAAPEPPGPLLREDLSRLQLDLKRIEQTVQRSQAETKADLQQLDLQLRKQLGELQPSLAQLATRTDELGRELARVHGKLDELRHRLDGLARQPEGRPAPSGAAPPPPEPSVRPPEPRAAPPAPAAREGDLYQTAYIDYTKGNYKLAIDGFQHLLRQFPDSNLADDAQYYIGEARFSMAREAATKGESARAREEYERAAQEFRQVLIRYPQGDKVRTALYKEALVQFELGNPTLAEARLQYLMDKFPGTEEALKAKDDLERLRARKR